MLHELVDDIRTLHRARRFAMKVQQKMDRALESFVRLNATDWAPDMTEDERDEQNKRAAQLIVLARDDSPERLVQLIRPQVLMTDNARAFADASRRESEKGLEKLARRLPVMDWAQGVVGFGPLGLATIVGEAGDLGGYETHSKLWKRLGYAPYDGLAGSSWKRPTWRPRTLTSDEWKSSPFSGERYALMHQIVVWLVNNPEQRIGMEKSGTPYGRPAGDYGAAYVHRREHTASTHPDWTKQHAHMDALRYAMKRLLRDLWRAWRGDGARDALPQGQVGRAPLLAIEMADAATA